MVLPDENQTNYVLCQLMCLCQWYAMLAIPVFSAYEQSIASYSLFNHLNRNKGLLYIYHC